ncbi:WD repeat-containing protein [Coprinopsis sp. MPI-PUGE-AT-0042]|nr:WD repeat-containing protein [Coprinopsis sp. MPI-PUGE-AT-0042]
MTFTPSSNLRSLEYLKVPSSTLPIKRLRKAVLSDCLQGTLDRVNVLGDEVQYGHQGCVNALSWADNGNVLLSGGDDTTVRLWRMESSDLNQYPYVCRSVMSTGHTGNIFSVKMLPFSSRIVTCAADKKIRVFDASTALEVNASLETAFSARQSSIRLLRCHKDRVKKIVTEDSPDVFLSLSEDGTVRQHDLRVDHSCRQGCPAALLEMPIELSTISMSPRTPYQFVVAGYSQYGYLFDRRHIGRVLQREWGMVPSSSDRVLTCVRRFGRTPQQTADGAVRGVPTHVTGSRISQTNGHEVLLSYSADKVYMFSTYDQPQSKESMESLTKAVVSPNKKDKEPSESAGAGGLADVDPSDEDHEMAEDDDEDEDGSEDGPEIFDAFLDQVLGTNQPEDDGEEEGEEEQTVTFGDVPVIHPRAYYAGTRNTATVKDVNFLGPSDECIVSGSDDGNWFMWDKSTGRLVGIYEGDSSIVNVIEGHPQLPLVACSGLDHTVKLFAPTKRKSAFSRISNAEGIVSENARLSRVPSPGIRGLGFITTLLSRAANESSASMDCQPQ